MYKEKHDERKDSWIFRRHKLIQSERQENQGISEQKCGKEMQINLLREYEKGTRGEQRKGKIVS